MEEPKIVPMAKSVPGRQYKRRVRNIVIHKPMQREFTFVLIALLMISSLAIGFVIHHTIHAAIFGGGFRFGKVSPYEVLSDVSYQLIIRVSCVLFVTLIVVGLFGLLFLHRVAGPVYRFRQTLLKINKGEMPGSIKLREGDFFTETADEINVLLKRLNFEKNRHDQAKNLADEIASASIPDPAGQKVITLREILHQAYPEEKK